MSWISRQAGLLFLIAGVLGFTACYNNAHLRTQRALEAGEKVYSGSGTIAMARPMEYGSLNYTGIPGFRGELSLLTGKERGEAGPYAGIGFTGDEKIDFIAGYEYKRYRYLGRGEIPWKLGVQGEIDYTPGGEWGAYGTAFQLRPSLVTMTNTAQSLYWGLHGIAGLGRLRDWASWSEFTGEYDERGYPIDEYHEGTVDYQFTSIGAGATAGLEFFLQNSSIQMQVDASILRHSFYSEGYSPEEDEWYGGSLKPSSTTFMVTGSAGMNMFKPAPAPQVAPQPYPVPYYYEKETHEEEVEEEAEIIFDPATGEPIKEAPERERLQFDPETGEPIQEVDTLQFDPETGELIQKSEVLQFGPETGLPVAGEPEIELALEYHPDTGELIQPTLAPKTPKPELEAAPKLTRAAIVMMAKHDAKGNHKGSAWALGGGFVSCGAAGLGGMLGAMVARFPGFIIGAAIGALATPTALANAFVAPLTIPKELRNATPQQRQIYHQTYVEETGKLRRGSIIAGELGLVALAGAGLLIISSAF